MKTNIEIIQSNQIKPEQLNKAATILQSGGLVAFPTETVYGLGGNALDDLAAKKIYKAKGRPSDNPLIIHIADGAALDELAREVPKKAKKLTEAFWPGPLTIILKKDKRVPDGTTGGLDTVAIRMPNHRVALALIEQSGIYIAAPSANTSGRPSPTRAEHVIEDLDGKIEMIIDGGPVGIGLESTIVDLTEEVPIILRPGSITKTMLEEVIGKVEMDPAILQKNIEEDIAPKAPGMKYKHYAPKGELIIVEGAIEKVISFINERIAVLSNNGIKVGVITTDETRDKYKADIIKSLGKRTDEQAIAKILYNILREFDKLQVEVIYSECFYSNELGYAIMNRLLKAAGYQVIQV